MPRSWPRALRQRVHRVRVRALLAAGPRSHPALPACHLRPGLTHHHVSKCARGKAIVAVPGDQWFAHCLVGPERTSRCSLACPDAYFVRHGESQANVDRIFAGIDRPAPLTRLGRQQARLAGRAILDMKININQIVSSPLGRARETAEIIAASVGIDPAGIVFDVRLIEYDVGELAGKSTQGVTPAQLVGAAGAEDPVAFRARVREALGDASPPERECPAREPCRRRPSNRDRQIRN